MPWTTVFAAGHPQSAITLGGEIIDDLLGLGLGLLRLTDKPENNLRCSFGDLEGLVVLSFNGRLGTLAHRIKGHKRELLVWLERL